MIRFAPPRRSRHLAIGKRCAVLVGNCIERRDFLGGEPARLGQDGIDKIVAEFGMTGTLLQVGQTADMFQSEGNLIDGCAIHSGPPKTNWLSILAAGWRFSLFRA